MAQESGWRAQRSTETWKVSHLYYIVGRTDVCAISNLCDVVIYWGNLVVHSMSVKTRIYSGLFFLKEKTEGNPSVHDQPERGSLREIHIFTLTMQDEDIDPHKVPSGLVVAHPSLMGSILRWK